MLNKVSDTFGFAALRLYPVFGNLARTALSDTKLPTGGGVNRDQPVNVKVGTKYFAHFYALHRDEKVFGSDVESFRPDRWKNIYPTPWQYMPFGGGQRPCLGQQKAKFDASFLLIKMLQCFESIKSHDDRNWAGDTRLTTWNANGCKVGLVRRWPYTYWSWFTWGLWIGLELAASSFLLCSRRVLEV